MAKIYQGQGVGLLNYYVDPSHIHKDESFYQTVDCWRRVARPVNYSEFLEELVPKVQSSRFKVKN